MPNVPHMKITKNPHGFVYVRLSDWKWFADFVQKILGEITTFAFRGHRKSNWHLESTLDREVRTAGLNPATFNSTVHLLNFRAATRGRRGPNPQALPKPDDWWALGQHHGLSTPLLDWTESPFVALFFAFEKPRQRQPDERAVWAIARALVERRTDALQLEQPPVPGIRFITPQSDENARLVNQRGLFSRGPAGMTYESWVTKQFENSGDLVLLKVTGPEKKKTREDCLRLLNRMNINHLTLFPDLYGASKFCGMSVDIRRY